DIAHSYIQYYLATKDKIFLKEMGLEVLIETARLWIDVGYFAEDGSFRINTVTGPDEYTCLVNNNYYTNVLAQQNLIWAKKAYQLVGNSADFSSFKITEAELSLFQKAADQMYLPVD